MSKVLSDLQEIRYGTVAFPLSHNELTQAALAALKFFALPSDMTQQFFFKIDPEDRGSNVGFMEKGTQAGEDSKRYFHWHESASIRFERLLQDADQTTLDFLRWAEVIYKAAKTTLSALIESEFEPQFPGMHARFFPKTGYPKFYLRFLEYRMGLGKQILAKGHNDRGHLTLAIAESSPGLRIGTGPDSLVPVEHGDGQALVMAGIRLQEITSDKFAGSWHDVVQERDHAVSEETARWAIVLFADTFEDDNRLTFEDVHQPQG